MPFRLLTPDAQYADDAVIERRTAGPDVTWEIFREREQWRRRIPDAALERADALVVWHEVMLDEPFIARLPRCRIIVRAGVGFDHIDIEAAGRAGIPVCNTPDYGTSEVADHAIALLLALRRGIVAYHDALAVDPVGAFDSTRAPDVARLRGRTIGIVGLGRIGIATALRAKAFGMRVVAYDPYLPRGVEIAVGVDRVDAFDALLAVADAVSLHCPLTGETRNMIDARALALMQPHAVLINTARGAIVDIPALIDALKSGRIAGAGIDVLPGEPPGEEDAITAAYRGIGNSELSGRLVMTPHAAWSSAESREDARRLSVETAMLYLRDGVLRNLVNGDFLKTRRPLESEPA